MYVVFERIRPRGQRCALAGMFFVLAATSAAPSRADDKISSSSTITVVLDHAKVMKLPEGVATLVLGNPLIADISIQAGGMLVLTGKGYGVTNLLVLDRSGSVLAEKTVQVQGPRDNMVVMYRGMERESYSCAPKCEPRIILGDSPGFFGNAMGQIGARTGQAQGTVQTSK
jgi:Flp pilus assembly secretin CpaC